MYEDCTANCEFENEKINIKYNTGVQQGDNASPVMLADVMKEFLDTLKLRMEALEFQSFKSPKSGNLKALNGCLIGQPASSKGTPFEFKKLFFVNHSIFIAKCIHPHPTLPKPKPRDANAHRTQ